jgi:hypothetical protein
VKPPVASTASSELELRLSETDAPSTRLTPVEVSRTDPEAKVVELTVVELTVAKLPVAVVLPIVPVAVRLPLTLTEPVSTRPVAVIVVALMPPEDTTPVTATVPLTASCPEPLTCTVLVFAPFCRLSRLGSRAL